MALLTWDDVEDFASQLSAVSDGAQTAILAYVNESVNIALLGGEGAGKLHMVRLNLAAHMGELTLKKNAEGGPTKRERIGAEEIELEYAALTSTDALVLTSYGREYARLLRSSAARVGFVTGTRRRCW